MFFSWRQERCSKRESHIQWAGRKGALPVCKEKGNGNLNIRPPWAAERLLAPSQQWNGTSALQLQETKFCQQPEWTSKWILLQVRHRPADTLILAVGDQWRETKQAHSDSDLRNCETLICIVLSCYLHDNLLQQPQKINMAPNMLETRAVTRPLTRHELASDRWGLEIWPFNPQTISLNN